MDETTRSVRDAAETAEHATIMAAMQEPRDYDTVRTCAIPVGLQRACTGPAFRGIFLNDTVPKAGAEVFSRLKSENTELSEQGPGTCAVTASRRARTRVRFALTRPQHGALPLTRPQCARKRPCLCVLEHAQRWFTV